MRIRFVLAALAATFVVAPSASAQDVGYPIGRGSLMLGGNVEFTNSGGEGGDRYTYLVVNPSLGYFVSNGLLIGADLSLSSYPCGDITGGTCTSFGAGPRMAYFFGRPGATTFPFVGASIAFETGSGDYSAFGGGISAGAVFMVARNVGLSAEAFGQFLQIDVGAGSYTGNNFGIRGGVVAFIY